MTKAFWQILSIIVTGVILTMLVVIAAEAQPTKPACHHEWIVLNYEVQMDSIDWTKVHSIEAMAKLLSHANVHATQLMCSKCGQVINVDDAAQYPPKTVIAATPK